MSDQCLICQVQGADQLLGCGRCGPVVVDCASRVLCRDVVMLLWRLSCRVVPSAEETILLEKLRQLFLSHFG